MSIGFLVLRSCVSSYCRAGHWLLSRCWIWTACNDTYSDISARCEHKELSRVYRNAQLFLWVWASVRDCAVCGNLLWNWEPAQPLFWFGTRRCAEHLTSKGRLEAAVTVRKIPVRDYRWLVVFGELYPYLLKMTNLELHSSKTAHLCPAEFGLYLVADFPLSSGGSV